MKRIIINTPDINKPGGVANHFRGLKPYWNFEVTYNFIGRRSGIPGFLILPYDILKFVIKCLLGGYDAVLLNPSLGSTALKRDAIFLKISDFIGIKTFVFIHGWNQDLALEFDKKPAEFTQRFRKAAKFIVLSSTFKIQMRKWGVTQPIKLGTTKVDDRLVANLNYNEKSWDKTILFLARVEAEKGIFLTLEAFRILKETHREAELIVAGTGSALQEAKEYVRHKEIYGVSFLGNISGDILIQTFVSSSIYLLPTFHGEGMPTSVLEAMAFGLPVISRPVGGLVDFFEEDKMGYLIDSLTADHFAEKMDTLFKNTEKLKIIGSYNKKFAEDNFMASKVVTELEKILANE